MEMYFYSPVCLCGMDRASFTVTVIETIFIYYAGLCRVTDRGCRVICTLFKFAYPSG